MPTDVAAALAEAKALVASLESYDGTPTQHLSLLTQTNRVRSALEEPYDMATRFCENLATAGALYMLNHLGTLSLLPSEGSITAADLAKEANVDVSVITRAMRIIAVSGISVEVGVDEYASNPLSSIFQPEGLGYFVVMIVDFLKTWGTMPKYAETHEPSDLYDLRKSPFAFMEGCEGMTYYEVISLDPRGRNLWNLTMQTMEKQFPIVDMFHFPSLKETVEREPERAAFVDVGGGRGQALKAIMEDCGGKIGGRWILQDLPVVIESLKEENLPGVETMVYDIFTPQPVKDAHVYFMRRLLHDFYNPVCATILRNTALAMGPTSRLLVVDMLVPDFVEVGGPLDLYWLDFALMTMTGKEKKMGEFRAIFEEAGLEIVEVHPSKIGRTVTIETRLKRV